MDLASQLSNRRSRPMVTEYVKSEQVCSSYRLSRLAFLDEFETHCISPEPDLRLLFEWLRQLEAA